jgi:hypothetical protein
MTSYVDPWAVKKRKNPQMLPVQEGYQPGRVIWRPADSLF